MSHRSSDTPLASYAAFCRKYGFHTPKGASKLGDWNQEIVNKMTEDLEEPWQRFCGLVEDFFTTHRRNTDSTFDQAVAQVTAVDRTASFLGRWIPADNLIVTAANRTEIDSVQALNATLLHRKRLLHRERKDLNNEYAAELA